MTPGKYGPETPEVERFLAALRGLTGDQWDRINDAYSATAAKAAVYDAFGGSGSPHDSGSPHHAHVAAHDAAHNPGTRSGAAVFGAFALALRYLAGSRGFTRERYQTLAGPCMTVPELARILALPELN